MVASCLLWTAKRLHLESYDASPAINVADGLDWVGLHPGGQSMIEPLEQKLRLLLFKRYLIELI